MRITLLSILLATNFLMFFGSAAGMEIVTQGQSATALVIPDKPFPVVQRAAEELQYHIRKSTGAELQIVSEGQKPDTFKGLIYLGNCRATVVAGIDTEKLPPAGFVVRVVGSDLFLAGRDNDRDIGNRWAATWHGTLWAAYEFLEKQMGVRWLWPGELGEVIPARSDLVLSACDHTGVPPFLETGLDKGAVKHSRSYWPSPETHQKFAKDQQLWLLRHRLNTSTTSLRYGHYFYRAGYVKRFLNSRADFFQQLPDGTRGYLPGKDRGKMPPHAISMCVSNRYLHKQMIVDWQAKRPNEPGWYGWFVNACENDTAGSCTCAKCRAWDAPDPRFEDHDYWSEGKVVPDNRWQAGQPDSKGRPAPSLADRYAKFYLALQKEAEKVDPQAVVCGYAYANYRDAPVQTKLNDRIIILMVGWPGFPWTTEDIQTMRKNWDDWYTTGAKLFLRPNTMLSGHNFPFIMVHKLKQEFDYARSRGLIGTNFDSLTGQWAAQGPTLYVLARMHVHPDWPVEKILDEYYAGFGEAEPAVRRYFEYWENVSDEFSEKLLDRRYKKSIRYTGWSNWYKMAPKVFTPPVMTEGRKLLKDARQAAQDNPMSQSRVAFLEKGLIHANLTVVVARAYEDQQEDPKNVQKSARYRKAMKKLVCFRNRIASENISNIGFLAKLERGGGWDHSLK